MAIGLDMQGRMAAGLLLGAWRAGIRYCAGEDVAAAQASLTRNLIALRSAPFHPEIDNELRTRLGAHWLADQRGMNYDSLLATIVSAIELMGAMDGPGSMTDEAWDLFFSLVAAINDNHPDVNEHAASLAELQLDGNISAEQWINRAIAYGLSGIPYGIRL